MDGQSHSLTFAAVIRVRNRGLALHVEVSKISYSKLYFNQTRVTILFSTEARILRGHVREKYGGFHPQEGILSIYLHTFSNIFAFERILIVSRCDF